MFKIFGRVRPSFAQLQSTVRSDFRYIRPAIFSAGHKINDLIVKTLDTQVFSTWSERPKVTKRIVVGRSKVDFIVTVNGDNFFFATVGAKPHIIQPKDADILAFPLQFTPKTKVGTLTSVSGGKNSSGAWFFGDFVEHPGFEPRNLDELILRKLGNDIYDILYNEIARVL